MSDHGKAGKALDSAGFGEAGKRGAEGERWASDFLAAFPDTAAYDTWLSLRLPDSSYSSDVDLALSAGREVVLVDVKAWKGPGIYWTLKGKPMLNLTRIKHDDRATGGKVWKPLSRNMEAAVDMYQRELPGYRISGMVLFVPATAKSPTSVAALTWPGGIRSFLVAEGVREMISRLGVPQSTGAEAVELLSRMTR